MSCFRCCSRRGQQPKNNKNTESAEGNQPVVVAISSSDNDGVQEQGTGILISDHLVLTSHMGLPSKDSARDGHIVLRSVGSDNSTPKKWPSSSTILTRKLLPQRLFLTNPSLGLTIVACEPVISNLSPKKYEVPKASEDALKLGCSVYVLGQVQHDDREGLLMFGEGLISREDEQVIEFYSLDGYVWAPGSAGFDKKGTFAFVVGDRRPPSKVSCPLRRRWSYALSKGPGARQPGILIHAVRDWTKDTWSGDFNTLWQLTSSRSTSSDLTELEEEEKLIEQQRALSRRIDEIQNSMRDDRESLFAASGPLDRVRSPKIGAPRGSLQECGKNFYDATDSSSKVSCPIARIQEIPVQPCFHPVPVVVPCSNLNIHAQSLALKPESPPALGGIATLAGEELEEYDDENDLVPETIAANNENPNSLLQHYVEGSVNVDFHSQREFVHDGTLTCASPQHESKSPRSPSCWFSTWWRNFRPSSSQTLRDHSLQADVDSAAAGRANRQEEVMTDCLEPNSPPRRFLVRGTYTATPRREFSSSQSSSHILNHKSTDPTSLRDSCFPSEGMPKPFSPRNQRPCKCTPQASPRSLSPEIPYLQIHRSPTGGCRRQSDIPWKPNGGLDSRRILHPSDSPRVIGVARTRTYPRDYCPARSEDDKKTLEGVGKRKVPAGCGTCMKIGDLSPQQSDATIFQDRITQNPIAVLRSPRESSEENRNLESGLSCYLEESSASQSARIHGVPNVIVSDSICQNSTSRMISSKTSERVIEITCFQTWKKFVRQKKNMAVESMRSLFSPCTFSVSTPSFRSISRPPAVGSTTYNLEELVPDERAIAVASTAYFVGSPLSTSNCSECPMGQILVASAPQQREEQAPHTSFHADLSQAQMPNWATKQQTLQGESADLSNDRQLLPHKGREEQIAVEAAPQAEVKIWNGSSNLSHEDETGAKDPSPSNSFEAGSKSRKEPCTEKYMMKKDKTGQRKEGGVQRPRWSIRRINQGQLVVGSVDDPTKRKIRMIKHPLVTRTGGVKVLVSQDEGSMPKRNSGGVRALANHEQHEVFNVRKAEHEEGQTGTRSPSPSRKLQPINTNGKMKSSARNSVDEHSTSPTKQPLRSTSRRLLEAPVAKKGSSVGSSSSEREGRPRWR